jgi:hypothetical protein
VLEPLCSTEYLPPDALLRCALTFRTRIAMTAEARTDGSRRGGCPS